MEILVLGAGARQHALAWRLARDEGVRRVRIAPGNAGTAAVAEAVDDLDLLDPVAVARHAARERYDLVVIGPEGPLAAGVADALMTASVPVFGPSRAAARLETSKTYAKEVMRRAGVATAASATFRDPDAAFVYARRQARPPVVKADGLADGKGVVVPDTPEEAEEAIRARLAGPGAEGGVILEERLEGQEVSAFALISGEAVVPLAAACDYKRLGDGDIGPNTGGMGAYSPVPWFGPAAMEAAVAEVFEPVAWRMSRDGAPYRGLLYAGLMLTATGPMVLEFNVRFGDPEAQVVLPLLDGELANALLGVARGERGLMEDSVAMRSGAAVGVVLASEGYPDAPQVGRPLAGADPASRGDAGPLLCFHAATRRVDGGYESTGGRVATFVGLGDDLATAREHAYAGIEVAKLEGGQLRHDIAAREVSPPG
ncbi:MAG TPA: phosphoribosylamine--glycine ligase [Candidatus Limnocylindria bacterium]|nr:phosphoribosylamine--glycine ligase [Candidatus Limnocylindria bacterium]